MVNKIFFILMVCCVCSFHSMAQTYPGYKVVGDLPAFKKTFAKASGEINSIAADFVQEKTLVALTETITSKGKLWFKRDNKVRMDYVSPFVYKMIMNGDKMFILDDQKETQVNVRSNKLFQQVNRIMIDCMQGTILESNDFTTQVFENESTYLLVLTPASKNLKQFFQAILLTVEKKDNSPRSIELKEPGGDMTIITLSNKTLNGPLKDEVFSF